MKKAFRQSMAWLHNWAGLLTGWVLFFVFLTGTFGYVNSEVTRWMKPELPLASSPPPASSLLPAAEQWLKRNAAGAKAWWIYLPGDRSAPGLSVAWLTQADGGEGSGRFTREALNPVTGEVIETPARETGGGGTLYAMHYALHYMSFDWAIRIVGVCAMFMMVAILSGIIAHKKIFKDFFTFRPGRGQRSWLDGHNLLSVTALPFHLMITWSGLLFYLFLYMSVAVDALYPEGPARDRFYSEVYGYEKEADSAEHFSAVLQPIGPLLARAEREFGAGKVGQIYISDPGRDNARIAFYPQRPIGLRRDHGLRFDGNSGVRLPDDGAEATAPSRFSSVLLTLHEGRFAGTLLRLLYVIAGLAGTAMVATGLLLWSAKRKAKLKQSERPHFGIASVDVLNLGTIMGLPISIATYFWANRLIPVGLAGRGEWEVHAMFITWGLIFLYAIWRKLDHAWIELAWLAAAAWGLLPVLNALTTNRHLGVTIPAGDWTLVSIDLGMLVAGLFFGFMARTMQRKQASAATLPARTKAATPQPEPVE